MASRYKIEWSKSAQNDIERIATEIRLVSGWEISVQRHIGAIISKGNDLDMFPIRNSNVIYRGKLAYRRVTVRPCGYRIIYRVLERKKTIRIVRILRKGASLSRIRMALF